MKMSSHRALTEAGINVSGSATDEGWWNAKSEIFKSNILSRRRNTYYQKKCNMTDGETKENTTDGAKKQMMRQMRAYHR